MNVSGCTKSPSIAFEPSGCGAPATSSASRTRISAKAEFNTDLTITTAEGDKVTLSASLSSETEFNDYALGYRKAGFGLAERGSSLRQSRDLSVAVSIGGDLSHKELADIRKLMHNLQKASRKLENGNFGAAAMVLDRVRDLDSMASFDFSAQASREVTASAGGIVQT